jgi:hypothetical protein
MDADTYLLEVLVSERLAAARADSAAHALLASCRGGSPGLLSVLASRLIKVGRRLRRLWSLGRARARLPRPSLT